MTERSGERPPPRLVLADDHPSVLAAVVRLLEGEFDIVGTAGDGATALGLATSLAPDVAVLDISMPQLDGIEVTRRLAAAGSRVRVVVLTVHDDPDIRRAALEAGALGYVLKLRMQSELAPAVRAALGASSSRSCSRRSSSSPCSPSC